MMNIDFFWYAEDLSVYGKDSNTGQSICFGNASTISQACHFMQTMTDEYKKNRMQRLCQQKTK